MKAGTSAGLINRRQQKYWACAKAACARYSASYRPITKPATAKLNLVRLINFGGLEVDENNALVL